MENSIPKKRVLHGVYGFKIGGAEKVVSYYAQYHNRDKFELIICSLTSGGELEEEIKKLNVKTIILNKQKISPIIFLARLIKFIRKEKINIIHSHNFVVNNWFIIAAIFSGVRNRIRTDHTARNQFYKKGILFSIVSKIAGIFNTKVISVSSKVSVSNQKKNNIFAGRKYITIYNGVDPDLYLSKEIDRDRFYKEFMIEGDPKIVGNVGNLTPQKGQRYLIDAAKIILDQYKDVFFLIVGRGPLRDELVAYVKKLGIEKKIVFAGFRTDIPELLQLMDIFVLSSLREGFPISILEAMAAKRPCVVTDVGGNSEAVDDGVTGYVVPPEDSFQLADKILKLLKEDNLRNSFGEKGRKRVLENFTAERMVKETEKIYEL